MTASTQDDFAALAAYLRTNRAFVAPAVDQAIRSLRIADGARVLDAGTGAGGGLVALARAAADVRVVAVDLNPAVIDVDIADATELLTPGSSRYVLDDPGYYVVHPTILATGRR